MEDFDENSDIDVDIKENSISSDLCYELLQPITAKDYLHLEPVHLLGEGGFGAVIKARCTADEKSYAVKLVSIEIPKMHRGVYDEFQYAALMRNELSVLSLTARERIPFCLSLIAYDFTDKYLRIVTELGDRGSLFDFVLEMSQHRTLSQQLARFYCAEMVVGIGFLHKHGIIHRDLGPANILVDSQGHLLISDFGLSVKAKNDNAREGNYEYNAPEMLRNDTYDCTVDWWSVGLTLHFMLTGKNPAWISGLEDELNVERIVNERPISWSRISPIKDAQLKKFLKSIVNHNPQLRLGRNGFEEVMQHPYLANFSVRKLIDKAMPPPLPNNLLYKEEYKPKKIPAIDRQIKANLKEVPLDFRKPRFFNFYEEIILL